MQTPTTTRITIPGDLAENNWYRTIAVTGVATSHELWVNESGDEAVYVVAPGGGPIGAMARWARTDAELPAWTFVTMDPNVEQFAQQVEAEDYVVAQARAEVWAELRS